MDISVNVTNSGAANVSVSNGSTVNATVGNGGAVNVSLGTVSSGSGTVVSGTVQVGKVTTLAAGSSATVTNTDGTSYAASLDFGIPVGATGPAGKDGVNGKDGVTPSFAIGEVTTVAAGGSATVKATPSNGGANVTLDFGIPRGDPGTGGSGSSVSLSDATPAALGTASAGNSTLAARADHIHALPSLSTLGAAAASHSHNYVTTLNSLTGGVTLAAGSGVTLSTSGSTLTIDATTTADSDGGFYEGYIPANTITIVSQPTNQTSSGGAASFSVAANSTPGGTLSYQWQRQDGGYGNFVDVDGATSATLSLSGLLNTVDDADRYRVVLSATNAAVVISSSALLTVPANVITITSQPSNQTANSGAATFTASASVAPSGTPSYQWQRSNDAGVSFSNVSGATSASLALAGLTVGADGNARFRVVVSATNAASVTSNSATLTVEANNTITITSQPSNQTASGGAATFSASATSSPGGTPAYQWQKGEYIPATSTAWSTGSLPDGFNTASRVGYGNGLFVALSSTLSSVATSADGRSWTSRTAISAQHFAYGNGIYVCAGSGYSSAASQDGTTWTAGQLPYYSGYNRPSFRSLCYGAGLFVALIVTDELGDSVPRIATSTDGVTWTNRTLPAGSVPAYVAAYYDQIAYGNGLFVAISSSLRNLVTSSDGVNWSLYSGVIPSGNWSNIAFGGGLFFACDYGTGQGSRYYMTSADGQTWGRGSHYVTADWRGVAYGDGGFVLVSSGTPSTSLTVGAASGVLGDVWSQRAFPSNNGWRSVAFGGGRFVAVNYGSAVSAAAASAVGAFSNISGATSSSLARSSLTASADNGDQYRVVVSAANAASVTSNAATLTVT